jgi:hypothetical protein
VNLFISREKKARLLGDEHEATKKKTANKKRKKERKWSREGQPTTQVKENTH